MPEVGEIGIEIGIEIEIGIAIGIGIVMASGHKKLEVDRLAIAMCPGYFRTRKSRVASTAMRETNG